MDVQGLISLLTCWEKSVQVMISSSTPLLQNKKAQKVIIASNRQDQMAQNNYNAKG